MARRARGGPDEAGPPLDAEQRLVSHGQSKRDLDAGQVGVSLVRRLGSGVPYYGALSGRYGFRQRTARPDAADILPAPHGSDSGLRVEFQRRQSTSACLGL